ncbi:MAG: zinc-binding alcohol dehydrogenase family protein [Erythrobacter sp.]|uniref:zinc-binding alcohol dehydrogenase family protein n=1 Tax=Erythrobacter sp. TaxID=1042 RepID=UPI003A83A543
MSSEMTAVVIHEAGGPEVLKLERRPVPVPRDGEVLIRVRAFGLNRSELFTRQGHSPNVAFPRILGIEAVGEVVAAPGGEFAVGAIVATAMGGMGRAFDGGYAEFTKVPAHQVQRLETSLDWATLGAVPEMLQTAWGSLFQALELERGDTLLIRGGTTSVGLAAAAIARSRGATVAATTRDPGSETMLRENGADHVIIDSGRIADEVRSVFPCGARKVLELVGTTTLLDSLQCTRKGGTVVMTGMVGNAWALDNFSPMDAIPTTVRLTTYSGGSNDFMRTPLQDLVREIELGHLRPKIGKVFQLSEIVEAHRTMEENRAGGKIVVLV